VDYPLIVHGPACATPSSTGLPFSKDTKIYYRPQHIDVVALRKRMHMTQKQFCRRFGFSLATLRHWERGDRRPL